MTQKNQHVEFIEFILSKTKQPKSQKMLVTQESRNNANMLPVALVGGRLKIKSVLCSKLAVPHSTDGKWFET